MDDAQKNREAWDRTIQQARELDPVIREAMRPVFSRLASDAPNTATALAVAMICRAMRMLETVDGEHTFEHRFATLWVAAVEVFQYPEQP